MPRFWLAEILLRPVILGGGGALEPFLPVADPATRLSTSTTDTRTHLQHTVLTGTPIL